MKDEKYIKERLNWFYSELNGVERGTIQVENIIAARKYYLGAINALSDVLEDKNEV